MTSSCDAERVPGGSEASVLEFGDSTCCRKVREFISIVNGDVAAGGCFLSSATPLPQGAEPPTCDGRRVRRGKPEIECPTVQPASPFSPHLILPKYSPGRLYAGMYLI